MKRKRNLYHLWFCFAMLLFLAVPFKVKAETATTPVSISVQYGQTEARTILNMINEMRTSSTDAWYWKQDDTTKTYCTNLQPLQYDYDLEKTAMQRAAEIAIIYSHTRPNNKDTFSAFYENSVYYTYAGENIAAGYGTADSVNDGWREDNELYAGQGHRRNMLNSKFNCVGIGHVYYNGFHYWVENFAYRDKVNTTPVSADNTETTLTIPVATSKISNFNITFDKDEYSLKTGESTSISVSDPTISVFGHWGSRFVFVTDTPDLTIADSTVATLSGTITGISEGDTTISASLYGLTAHQTAAVKVHNCENHWDDGKITTTPTCTKTGVKQYTCTICSETKTEEIAALGHDYSSDWTIDTAAACETVGSKSHHCTRCDSKIDVTEIPASGHSWNDGAITTEPTCTDEGVKTFTCNSCGKTRTEEVAALGHNYSSDWTIDTAAACETVGSKSHHCTRCDSKIDITEIPASGKHTWNNGVITKPATIAEEGVKTYTCTVCGVTRTETIAKLPMPTVTPVPTATPTPAITSAPTVTPTPSVSVGTKITDKKTGNIYKVTSSRSSSQTVAFIGNKVKTSVTIPTTIKIKGATYKVTEISTNAFKNNRKLKKVVIGQNIVRIGKNAFYGCKKLTSITIKSSRLTLKNIGKNAFKNTSPKATVKVPKKQKVLYNQILKKRGLNKKAKVK
ncbi:leucine-rich repeat protein [Blautia glucerasea]|uniref:leucine-rich repeat protein n=1 Tax=Blautia glucerasea TaxID=536633 RepID=UPI00156E9900|nr:leucine-rich repeat protein [Blautia glucerasea]NSD39105.1 leucine-rich repeat protein [Blautia glucerasea]